MQGAFGGLGADPAGMGLGDGIGGQFRGLHGVGDPLAVERVDHAARVAHQQQAATVDRLPVESHRERRALDLPETVFLPETPLLGSVGEPAFHQLPVIGFLEGPGGVEDTEADVAGAVAHPEDPAVAGHQGGFAGFAVPELQPRLEVVVVAARGTVVGAVGHPHRAVGTLVQPHGDRQARGVAVGGHHQRSAVLVAVTGPHPDDAAGAVVQDRLGHVGPLNQFGPATDGVPGHQVVEVGAFSHQSVGGEVGELRPVQLEGLNPPAVDAQPLVVKPSGLLGGVDAEAHQGPGGARGEPVSAHLLAREVALLQQQDTHSPPRQICRCRGSAGARTDDDDVGFRLWHSTLLVLLIRNPAPEVAVDQTSGLSLWGDLSFSPTTRKPPTNRL